jgi:hypothetical protein
MDGRVLHETMHGAVMSGERKTARASTNDGYSQTVAYDRVGDSRYLAHGRRDDAPPID